MKTVIGTFSDRDTADRAVTELRAHDFDKEISIVSKHDTKEEEYKGIDKNSEMFGGDALFNGASTGAVLGGIAGLAMGAGAIAIPGLGPLLAAGPIAGLLSGVAAGGVTGGLVDLGIPKERGEHFENEVKKGKILAAVHVDDEHHAGKAADILKKFGASDVEIH